jgi:hypothetical protein
LTSAICWAGSPGRQGHCVVATPSALATAVRAAWVSGRPPRADRATAGAPSGGFYSRLPGEAGEGTYGDGAQAFNAQWRCGEPGTGRRQLLKAGQMSPPRPSRPPDPSADANAPDETAFQPRTSSTAVTAHGGMPASNRCGGRASSPSRLHNRSVVIPPWVTAATGPDGGGMILVEGRVDDRGHDMSCCSGRSGPLTGCGP